MYLISSICHVLYIFQGNPIEDKRHLGSARNSRYGTWRYKQGVIDKRDVTENDVMEDYEKRHLGPARNAYYNRIRYLQARRKSKAQAAQQREAAKYPDVSSGLKRHVGPAFYAKYGPWKYNPLMPARQLHEKRDSEMGNADDMLGADDYAHAPSLMSDYDRDGALGIDDGDTALETKDTNGDANVLSRSVEAILSRQPLSKRSV